jgi:hypothetical protein
MENTDPKQEVKTYFTVLEQVVNASLENTQLIKETLEELVPGFRELYLKKCQSQTDSRAAQRSDKDVSAPLRADQLVQSLQSFLWKK